MKTPEEIIKKEIGINIGAGSLTPMDYGECIICLKSYHAEMLKTGIHAKALRKRGTDDIYYKFNGLNQDWDMVHTIPIIVEEWILRYYPVPPDAELVPIVIIVQEGDK